MSNARSRMGAYGRIPKALLRDGQVSARAKLLVAMVDEVAGHGEVTMDTLAGWLGCTVDTARRAVHEARDAGWLEVRERFVEGRQIASEYIANGHPQQAAAPEETGVRGSENWEAPLADSATPRGSENQESNTETYETVTAPHTVQAPKKKGSRLPEGWEPDDDLLGWAREHAPGVDVMVETEKFCDYWRAKAGRDAAKLDWRATWRNWIRNTYERMPAHRAAPATQQQLPQHVQRHDEEMLARRKAWLEARGSSVEEYEKHKHEPGWLEKLRAVVPNS